MVVILEAVPGLNFAIFGGLYAKYMIFRILQFLSRGSGVWGRDLDQNFGRNFSFCICFRKNMGKNSDRKNQATMGYNTAIPKWSQNDPKTLPKWYQNEPKNIQKNDDNFPNNTVLNPIVA